MRIKPKNHEVIAILIVIGGSILIWFVLSFFPSGKDDIHKGVDDPNYIMDRYDKGDSR